MKYSTAVAAVLVIAGVALAQDGPGCIDLVRISEAYRLADAVGEKVWPDWEAPFPLLLVTDEREFFTGADAPPEGFAALGRSTLLQKPVWSRARQFAPNLLATFPAFGPTPVVVIGRAEATGKTSTSWVLTVCHEHFHQLQMSDPDYYAAVDSLDLSGDDQTGMWMLNYPFPYADRALDARFAVLARKLAMLLGGSSRAERRAFWRAYGEFLGSLAEPDARYLRFQVWQEGVARYVELRVAEVAGKEYTPSLEFAGLPDASTFSAAAGSLRVGILEDLAAPDLASRQRIGFYSLGAGLALLLDQDDPAWKQQYLFARFHLGDLAKAR